MGEMYLELAKRLREIGGNDSLGGAVRATCNAAAVEMERLGEGNRALGAENERLKEEMTKSEAAGADDWDVILSLHRRMERRKEMERPGIVTVKVYNGINCNEDVWVKLTERGRRLLKACDYADYEEKNGFVKIQLWMFMHALGHGFIMGFDPPIENNMIYFKEPEEWSK